MTNTQTKTLVADTIKLFSNEEKVRGAANQSLLYTLIIGHEEKALPVGVDILQAYKAQGREAQKTRNNLLLANLFNVINVEMTDKGPVYKKRDDVSEGLIALLKTRLNRTLIVAAWIVHNGGTQSNMIRRNPNGLLVVRGKVYFSKKELEEAPTLADNWIVLDGRKGPASGKLEVLSSRASEGLNFKRETRGRNEDAAAKLSLAHLLKATEDKANLLQSVDKAVTKPELEAMRAAWIALGAAIKHAESHALPIPAKPASSPGEQVKAIKEQRRKLDQKHTKANKIA